MRFVGRGCSFQQGLSKSSLCKWTTEWRPEGGEDVSHVVIWDKSVRVESASAKAFRQESTWIVQKHGGNQWSSKREHGRARRGRGSCRVVYMWFLPAPPTFLWHQVQILQNKSNSKIIRRHLDFTEVVMEGAGSPHHGSFINLPKDACLSPDTILSFPLITPNRPLFIACLSYPEQFHPSALQFSLPSNHLPSYLGMREPLYILFWIFSPLLKNVGIWKTKKIFLLYVFNLYK